MPPWPHGDALGGVADGEVCTVPMWVCRRHGADPPRAPAAAPPLGPDGVSSFSLLQEALKVDAHDTMVFYAFDLLHLDGDDLGIAPLDERKAKRPPEARRQTERHGARGLLPAGLPVLTRLLHKLQDTAAALEKPPARLGQHHSAARALQQRAAQVGLQEPHLAAERRLRNIEDHGRAAEAAELGD